jgi:hypothetical protein
MLWLYLRLSEFLVGPLSRINKRNIFHKFDPFSLEAEGGKWCTKLVLFDRKRHYHWLGTASFSGWWQYICGGQHYVKCDGLTSVGSCVLQRMWQYICRGQHYVKCDGLTSVGSSVLQRMKAVQRWRATLREVWWTYICWILRPSTDDGSTSVEGNTTWSVMDLHLLDPASFNVWLLYSYGR